ncbi:hypothetical protein Tco_0146503 [Tanacetum coccineum]
MSSTPLPQLKTPTPTPTTVLTTTLIPALPDFYSLFSFDQKMSLTLGNGALSQRKQTEQQQPLNLSKSQLSNKCSRREEVIHRCCREISKDIIKDEVKSLLPQILPKEVSNFATPMIQSTVTESLENVVLSKSSSQPSREDKDKDEDPPAGPDQWLKKKKKSKDVEPSRGSKSKESKSSSFKGSKSQPKSSGKSTQEEDQCLRLQTLKCHKIKEMTWAKKPPLTFDELLSTPIEFSAYVMHNLKIDNLTQEILIGPAFNLLKGTCKSFVELEYHFEECYKAVTDQLDWNNPEGHEYPFDLSKPLPLIEAQWASSGSSSRKYTTYTTKTKADRYDNIEGIKDMVPELWSPVKFKEGDFPRLNLRDIEDLLLLLVQKKLSNLEQDVIFDLNVALRMFTRRIVILKRVEDLQLGVESYQKKLNITKPELFRSGISKLTPYTTYKNPQGIIYQDKFKRNRLMRSDELYKFCDDTLTSV